MKKGTRNVRIHKDAKHAARIVSENTENEIFSNGNDTVSPREKRKDKHYGSTSVIRVIALSLISLTLISALLVSFSVSWFMMTIESPGTALYTGAIAYNFSSYKKNEAGTGLVRYINSDIGSSATIDLYNGVQQNVGLFATGSVKDDVYFVVQKKDNSINLDTKISFQVEGINGSAISEYIGGFRFQLSNVTEEFVNLSGNLTSVLDYQTSETRSGNDCTENERKLHDYIYSQNEINPGTEYSLNTISGENGSLSSTDLRTGNVCVYRLTTYLSETAAEDPRYTGVSFGIRVFLQAGQEGAISGGLSEIYEVSSYADINERIASLNPGDTFVLTNSIVYDGDLIFNLPVNLVLGEYNLTVNGNLLFTSTYSGQFSVNTAFGGKLKVQKVGQTGGNLTIDASKCAFVFNGKNESNFTDVSVAGTVEVNCSIPDPENYADTATEYGFTINGANIRYGDNYKTITICDNTRVNITEGTEIGTLSVKSGSEVFSLINKGHITSVVMSGMTLTNAATYNFGYYCGTLNMPQIFIDNFDTIDRVVVPSIALKFIKDANGSKGNTRIIAEFESEILQITGGGTNYTDASIESVNENVSDVYNDGSYLIIYYKDFDPDDGVTITLNEIINGPNENYLGYLEKTGRTLSSLVNIKIICSQNTNLTSDDYATLKTFANLNTLDLSEAKSGDSNEIPANAFSGLLRLKNLTLPNEISALGSHMVSSTAVIDLYLPASISSISAQGTELDGVKYVHPQYIGTNDHPVVTNLMSVDRYIFAPDSSSRDMLSEYRSAYPGKLEYLFAEATLSDDGQYFYRKQSSLTADFVVWVGSNEVATSLNQLKTISPNGSTTYQIINIDDYAFYGKLAYEGRTLALELGYQLRKVGAYAFSGCTSITSLKIESAVLSSIGEMAFNGCTNLTTVSIASGNYYTVSEIVNTNTNTHYSIFNGCSGLRYLTLKKIQKVSQYLLREGPTDLLDIWSLVVDNSSKIEHDAYHISNATNVTLKELIIKNTEEIEQYAFQSCDNLQTVYLDRVTTVRTGVFANCISLKIVSAPDTTTVSSQVFLGCSELEVVSFPKVFQGTMAGFLSQCTALKIIDIGIPSADVNLENLMPYGTLPDLKLWIVHTENLTAGQNIVGINSALTVSSSAVIVVNANFASALGNSDKISSTGVNTSSLSWKDSASVASSAVRWSVTTDLNVTYYLSDFGLGDYLYCVNGNTSTVLRCVLEEIITTEVMPNVSPVGGTSVIGNRAFIYLKCIEANRGGILPTLIIPESVKEIDDYAFFASELSQIEGKGVATIGISSFENNFNLRVAKFISCTYFKYYIPSGQDVDGFSNAFKNDTHLMVLELGVIAASNYSSGEDGPARVCGTCFNCDSLALIIVHSETLSQSVTPHQRWYNQIKVGSDWQRYGSEKYKFIFSECRTAISGNKNYYSTINEMGGYLRGKILSCGTFSADQLAYASESYVSNSVYKSTDNWSLADIGYGDCICGLSDNGESASLLLSLEKTISNSIYTTPNETITGVPIRTICSEVYKNTNISCDTLIIAENIKHINNNAFEGMLNADGAAKSIHYIYLNNVEVLGSYVFKGIEKIYEVYAGEFLEDLGNYTFCNAHRYIRKINIQSLHNVEAYCLFGNNSPSVQLIVEVSPIIYSSYYHNYPSSNNGADWGGDGDSTHQYGVGLATETSRAHFKTFDELFVENNVEYFFASYTDSISGVFGYKITSIAIPTSGVENLIIPSVIPEDGNSDSSTYYPVLAIEVGAFSQLKNGTENNMLTISLPKYLLSLPSDNFYYVPETLVEYTINNELHNYVMPSGLLSATVSAFAVDSNGILYNKDYSVLVHVPAETSNNYNDWSNNLSIIATNAFANTHMSTVSFSSNSSILVMSQAFIGETLSTVSFSCPVILLSQSFISEGTLTSLNLSNTVETSKFLASDCISISSGNSSFSINVPGSIYGTYINELCFIPSLSSMIHIAN